jgi:predicted nucleic acid-binding protein
MSLALAIAMQSGITVYDAMYVAVAKVYETVVLTADRKLVEVLAKTEFAENVRWLGAGEAP